jgi:hypothetical protein
LLSAESTLNTYTVDADEASDVIDQLNEAKDDLLRLLRSGHSLYKEQTVAAAAAAAAANRIPFHRRIGRLCSSTGFHKTSAAKAKAYNCALVVCGHSLVSASPLFA